MTLSFGYWLLVYAAIAIIALIVLIARYRLNPFIVITLVSIGLALLAGMPASGVVGAYEAGRRQNPGAHCAGGGAGHDARQDDGRVRRRRAGGAHLDRPFRREERALGDGLHRVPGRAAAVLRGRFCVAGADCVYRGAARRRVDPDGRFADGRRALGGACAGAAAPGGDAGGAGVSGVGGADLDVRDSDRHSDGDHCRSAVRQIHRAAHSTAGGKPAGTAVPRP